MIVRPFALAVLALTAGAASAQEPTEDAPAPDQPAPEQPAPQAAPPRATADLATLDGSAGPLTLAITESERGLGIEVSAGALDETASVWLADACAAPTATTTSGVSAVVTAGVDVAGSDVGSLSVETPFVRSPVVGPGTGTVATTDTAPGLGTSTDPGEVFTAPAPETRAQLPSTGTGLAPDGVVEVQPPAVAAVAPRIPGLVPVELVRTEQGLVIPDVTLSEAAGLSLLIEAPSGRACGPIRETAPPPAAPLLSG
jgi:hypothetical protein